MALGWEFAAGNGEEGLPSSQVLQLSLGQPPENRDEEPSLGGPGPALGLGCALSWPAQPPLALLFCPCTISGS